MNSLTLMLWGPPLLVALLLVSGAFVLFGSRGGPDSPDSHRLNRTIGVFLVVGALSVGAAYGMFLVIGLGLRPF